MFKKLNLIILSIIVLIVAVMVLLFIFRVKDKTFAPKTEQTPNVITHAIAPLTDGPLVFDDNGFWQHPSALYGFSRQSQMTGIVRGGIIYLCTTDKPACLESTGSMDAGYISIQMYASSLELEKWLGFRGYDPEKDKMEDIKIDGRSAKKVEYHELEGAAWKLTDVAVKVDGQVLLISVSSIAENDYSQQFTKLLNSIQFNPAIE